MATTDQSTSADVGQLAELNLRFGEEERSGALGEEFFAEKLDPSFHFRRGNGTVVDREAYLNGLKNPNNTSELLETEILQVQVRGEQAFVEALVRFKGLRDGNPAEGVFRNLRLFEKRENKWYCVLWFNKKVGSLDAAPAPQ